jgi:glutamyl-tRNA synthetase
MKERVSFVYEIVTTAPYFFEAPSQYEEDIVKKRWNDESSVLLKLAGIYSNLDNPLKEDYENGLKSLSESKQIGAGKIIHPLRLAVSGMGNGPGCL